MILRYVLACVLGYLIGCFSTGLLVAKNSGHDIRSEGSKNTGATNVLRVLGVKKGLLTFAGDFVKATCAMLIGAWLLGKNGALLGGFAAVIGHNWPVFYGFKGGKGVACTIALMFLFLWQGLIAGALAILVVWHSRLPFRLPWGENETRRGRKQRPDGRQILPAMRRCRCAP